MPKTSTLGTVSPRRHAKHLSHRMEKPNLFMYIDQTKPVSSTKKNAYHRKLDREVTEQHLLGAVPLLLRCRNLGRL